MKNIQYTTTSNDTVNFAATREREFAAGNKYEIEIGNCASSDFAWFATEEEARAAHADLLTKWTEEAETVGEIEWNAIRLLGTDEDGDYSEDLTLAILDDSKNQ